MKKNNAFRRAVALMAALSITVSLAAPAFADTYYIDNGDITITKNEDGSQTIQQNGEQVGVDAAGEETVITTHDQTITTQESDLEGPAAEDSGFGPVVEDNYQPAPPAQPEDAEEPKDADQPESADQPENIDRSEGADQPENTDRQEGTDQPESAEKPKGADRQESADQQAQPQQAAPAAAPVASTPVHKEQNGFWGNTITVINKFADKVLNLTLKDVKIDVSDTGTSSGDIGKAALSVQGKGNVEIELDGKNELKSGYYRAGLEKTSQATGTLTLKDDNKEDDNKKAGSLTATGGFRGAGIGGQGKNEELRPHPQETQELYDASNITITGGTVNATGGSFGAGIGGGNEGKGKNITITDGTVKANGGYWAAGIGGGYGGSGENITITRGTVNAAGGGLAAGIGGGFCCDGENITITGGTVNATGGEQGAGIGGGQTGSGVAITINGGTVTAAGGGYGGAGIGGGHAHGSGVAITINGGTVTATGGDYGAGIGGGSEGEGKNITINGGTVNAAGGKDGAGIGGGAWKGNGKNITINGGSVTAAGGDCGAGIGGGAEGSGSNVTVSGAAQVTATVGKSKRFSYYGAGATIGNGGNKTGGELVDGEEIQADISDLLPGYIHHIIYDQDQILDDNSYAIVREWWEPVRPDGESRLDLLHVETLEGDPLPFDAQQQGSTLRVTTDNQAARLHGNRQALEALQEQGVEQIEFVTTLKTTTLSVADLLAEGGSWFALEHDGLVSRQLSAAQAESLKCWMH